MPQMYEFHLRRGVSLWFTRLTLAPGFYFGFYNCLWSTSLTLVHAPHCGVWTSLWCMGLSLVHEPHFDARVSVWCTPLTCMRFTLMCMSLYGVLSRLSVDPHPSALVSLARGR